MMPLGTSRPTYQAGNQLMAVSHLGCSRFAREGGTHKAGPRSAGVRVPRVWFLSGPGIARGIGRINLWHSFADKSGPMRPECVVGVSLAKLKGVLQVLSQRIGCPRGLGGLSPCGGLSFGVLMVLECLLLGNSTGHDDVHPCPGFPFPEVSFGLFHGFGLLLVFRYQA